MNNRRAFNQILFAFLFLLLPLGLSGCASLPDAVLAAGAESVSVYTEEEAVPENLEFVGSAVSSLFEFPGIELSRVELKSFSKESRLNAAANYAAENNIQHALLLPMYPDGYVVELYALPGQDTDGFGDSIHIVVSDRAVMGMQLKGLFQETIRGDGDYRGMHDRLI